MRYTKVILPVFLIFLSSFLAAQEYFQQEVNFKIQAELDDIRSEIIAFESIEYINNSPDSLNFIYFHLWPNAYRDRFTALSLQQLKYRKSKLYYSDESERGWIDSLDFNIDGKKADWNYDTQYVDICKLNLNEPLPPGGKIDITTPFHVKIPDGKFSRLGHYQQSYQLTQWYPKPAVYDREGWHQMPYLDIGEFYSEYGSYEVAITLPENYVVGATGNLQNESELQWLDSIAEATRVKTFFDTQDDRFPISSKNKKTIIYKEKNVHDFAWFADKRYHVLKGEVILPNSGRKVTTWAMFTNYEANLWKNSLEYINDAVYYYSKWIGDYEYNNCIALEGALSAGGGMEYPGVTIIGGAGDSLSLELVIMHEVGHNWFYSIIGSNEREHPWLDEGINSFYELRYMETKYDNLPGLESYVPKKLVKFLNLGNIKYQNQNELGYQFNARRNLDQAINLHSEDYSVMNYGVIVYMKAAFAFNYLMEYLGAEKFDEIMQEYFNKWKNKHPQPNDLTDLFRKMSDKDLDWFFQDLIKTTAPIDYKMKSVKKQKENNGYEITVKNMGKIAAPFTLTLFNDSVKLSEKWEEGFRGKKTYVYDSISAKRVAIDYECNIPDINKKNNSIRCNGVLKKLRPVRFKFLGGYEHSEKSEIYYLPLVAWNNYNKFMIGALFYNSLIPHKKFEYHIMPFFSFGTRNIAGSAGAGYTWYLRNGPFRYINLSGSVSQYAFDNDERFNYQRYKTELTFFLKKNHKRNMADSRIVLNAISAPDYYNYPVPNVFVNAGFYHRDFRVVNPWDLSVCVQGSEGFSKAWVEANYKISYFKPRKGLKLRAFAGKVLYSNTNLKYVNFRLSGKQGLEDYQYENVFLGRTENIVEHPLNIISHQFVQSDGGFASYCVHQSTNWMLSLHASTSFPGKIPLRFYGSIATYGDAWKNDSYDNIPYELGVEVSIIPDIFAVYFPVLVSKEIRNWTDNNFSSYWQRIRFMLNINKLEPFSYIKNLTM